MSKKKEILKISSSDKLCEVVFDIASEDDFNTLVAGMFKIFHSNHEAFMFFKDLISLYEEHGEVVDNLVTEAEKKAIEMLRQDKKSIVS